MAKVKRTITMADEIIVNKIYYIRKQKIMGTGYKVERAGKEKFRQVPFKFYVSVDSQRG